eukprot:gene32714-3599_t
MEPEANHPGTDEKTQDERPKREKAILDKANAIKFEWRGLATAFSLPYAEPSHSFAHWDYVLREGCWMSEDFMQERLWKQAAAVRIAQEAAKFDRSSLKPTVPKVLDSIECAEYGRVMGSDMEQDEAKASEPADSSEKAPEPLNKFPLLPYFTCTEDTLAATLKHLEDEDISRLARHAKAVAAYEVAYEAARYLQPPEEEELPSSSKKALGAGAAAGVAAGAVGGQPSKRKMKAHSQSLSMLTLEHADLDEDMGLGTSGLITGGGNALLKSTRRMGGELESTREKRKRKTRDFNDEEDYIPSAKNNVVARDRFPPRHGSSQLLARAEITTSGGGGPLVGAGGGMSGGLPSSNSLRQGVRPKTSAGKPGTSGGLPRLDGMTAGVSGGGIMGGHRGSYGSRGPASDRLVTWSTQDEHVLAAIVTEFGLNWSLVADVMRSYSSLSGSYRRPELCKQRYASLQRIAAQDAAAAAEAEGGEAPPPSTPNMMVPLMNKNQAKETLANALPTHADVLKRHQDVLAVLAARMKTKRMQDRIQLRESHKFRAEQHTSHYKILQSVNQSTGGKTLSPLDINPIEQPPPAQPSAGGVPPPNGGQPPQGQPPLGGQQPPGQAGSSHHQQQQQQSQQQASQQQHPHMGHNGVGSDGGSQPSLQLGNVLMGGSPSFGGLGQQQGQAGAQGAPPMSGGLPSQAATQSAAMAANQAKAGGRSAPQQQQQQGGSMGIMGGSMPPMGNAMMQGGPGGANGMAGMNPAVHGLPASSSQRSPSPQMNFNNLNQQQKNMLQHLGRQGGLNQAGMMRPPLNPQQQQAAAAVAGRFSGTTSTGQPAMPGGAAMNPALAAQIQKGLMGLPNNPQQAATLQAIHAKMAAAAAASQNQQQTQQQQGQAASRAMSQPTPTTAAGSPSMNPLLQGGAGGYGMQLGGTGGVGFGLPPANAASSGMNLQQQYYPAGAPLNNASRPQPNSQGGGS